MSWSIAVIGTKDAVRAKAVAEFDRMAAIYEGKEEANDILLVKARALVKLDALTFEYGLNGVKIHASGSDTPGMVGCFSLSVERLALTLDASTVGS